MYNPINEINVFQNKNAMAADKPAYPKVAEKPSLGFISWPQSVEETPEREPEPNTKSKTYKSAFRWRQASHSGGFCRASMMSHNSGAAAAKRRIAKSRHSKDRLVSNLLHAGEGEKALSELTDAHQLFLLNQLLRDIQKMRLIY